jgi:RNA polymerase sigma-70 factor (ECF subfamily)
LSGSPAHADDITAETFVRVWSIRDTIRVASVKAYLFTIARNLHADGRRRDARHVELPERLLDPAPGPEVEAQARQELQTVLTALQQLAEVDRAALLMRAQDGILYEEIAAALGLSLPAAKVKVHRARLPRGALRPTEKIMTNATRDVVVDLWPLYVSGEASPDTRALVESFLEKDPEFAERLREHEGAGLRAPAVALPADHERATLLRAQRRRARQSMIVNSLALLASAGMTTFYLWNLVPWWVYMFMGFGLPMPRAMGAAVEAYAWILRLGLPLVLLLIPLVFLFRKHIRVPQFLESGTVLAIATGIVLVLAQVAWLALLNEASRAIEAPYKALMAMARVSDAAVALRACDASAGIQLLQRARAELKEDRLPGFEQLDRRLDLSTALLAADAYTMLGDDGRAQPLYQEALRLVLTSKGPGEAARLEKAIRSGTACGPVSRAPENPGPR